MTAAICLSRTAMKFGALRPCPACGYVPDTETARIRSIMLTDHNHSRAELENLPRARAAGARPVFNEEQVARLTKEAQARPVKMHRHWVLVPAFVIAVAVLGLLMVWIAHAMAWIAHPLQ